MTINEKVDGALVQCEGRHRSETYQWNYAGKAPRPSQNKGLTVWMERAGRIRIPEIKTHAYGRPVANDVTRCEGDCECRRRLLYHARSLALVGKYAFGKVVSEDRGGRPLPLTEEAAGEVDAASAPVGFLGCARMTADVSRVSSATAFPTSESQIDARAGDRCGRRRSSVRGEVGAGQVRS